MLRDLRRLAEFDGYKTGVHRPTFSQPDLESRRWLADQFASIGLDPMIDGVGNVFGRSSAPGPKLLIGSHSESQNYAGWLDGALGVIYGLEIARAFRESPDCGGHVIEPVAWSDEESHFTPFLGSRSFIGDVTDAEIDAAADSTTGQPLREAIRQAGLIGCPRAEIDPRRYIGYLEAHIEQGDSLEASGLRIGVVTSIVAIWQYRITFKGVQNHAGTTRMAIRKDAGVALVDLCSAIKREFPAVAGPRSVWTTGRIVLDPGAPSIVPGGAEMLFQFRDDDPERLSAIEARLKELVEAANRSGLCEVELEVLAKSTPSMMDSAFQAAIEAAAERHAPHSHVRMPSGAGHDAQIIAQRVRAGMLFVPSIGGISHHWTENTLDADIVLGCQVLADAAEVILQQVSAQ
ncbi:hydantoinase/carbamoylase family amidase [Microvirga arabica]|uniref:hydantoinase/carbamoylase family amidase n=1 Tax=Microvirga arabica TaxID=1128671 RepID=UPI0035E41BA6